MKFAICNETFQEWPFDKAFAFARDCGYTGIEFAPYTIHPNAYMISAAKRNEIKRLVESSGLETVGLHWLLAFTDAYYLTSPEPDVRRRTSDYLKELARLCRDLGGRVLVLGSPKQRNLIAGVSHEEAMRYAADVIHHAMPTFAECGTTLAVEPLSPLEGDFLLTAAKGAELVEMVNSPQCRLHLDAKAMASEGIPIPDILRAQARHLEHFHANDANQRGPGMGKTDFVPILRTLREIGYDGWVSVEVFDYTPGIESLARDSIAYLRNCLERLEAA